ncbi:type IV toxin-antitoxin system AbiEi family antitoxin domain-containing protein [Leifsonia sp. NPDC014704]|uniref:type IV toxin-antitoxin system AbiEi family antitoxin domain-containing protein n=1 Tax=Leifsonia sp. NPDC014704 TaxID=3364123 RepID=UPI0036F46164
MIDERTLERLGGIATVHQLRAAGASAEELTTAVRGGTLRRMRRGVYALPAAQPDALAAVAARGRLSCVSAARSYGLWAGHDPRLHLQFSPHARAGPEQQERRGQVRHWLPTERGDQLWRVTVADCLRSVARCADEETAVAVFDTAITAGLVNPVTLRRILESQPSRARSRAVLARPGSESGVESIVRQRLQALGHLVEQQVHVPGVGRVDMRVDGVLYLEIDGFAFHAGRDAFERDRARDAYLAAAGSARLRVSAAQVRDAWPSVLHSIEAVVAHSANSQDQRDQPGVLACSIY